jgi:hypothetical protein
MDGLEWFLVSFCSAVWFCCLTYFITAGHFGVHLSFSLVDFFI